MSEKTENWVSAALHARGVTPREKDIALLLLDGKTRAEICAALGLSPGTVNTLCTRLYKRVGCRDATDLQWLLGVKHK